MSGAIFGLFIGILLTLGVAIGYVDYRRQNSVAELLDETREEIENDYRRTEVKRDQDLENKLAAHVEDRVKAQAPARKGYTVDMKEFEIYYDEDKEEIVWVTTYEFFDE